MPHQRHLKENAQSNGCAEANLSDGLHAIQKASLAIGTQGGDVHVWEASVSPGLSPLRLACTLVKGPLLSMLRQMLMND